MSPHFYGNSTPLAIHFPPCYNPTMDEDQLPVPSADTSFLDFQRGYEIQTRRKRGVLKRQVIAQAYQDAFELIGGVPRLALYAHNDPEGFYKLHARLIPTEQKQEFDGRITIVGMIAPTSLDKDFIEGTVDGGDNSER